jgi:hypothetical protein
MRAESGMLVMRDVWSKIDAMYEAKQGIGIAAVHNHQPTNCNIPPVSSSHIQ